MLRRQCCLRYCFVTLFQVSLAAFSILMDYFSSIPVTKKNLVTQQTQLLVSVLTFGVCSQVMFVSMQQGLSVCNKVCQFATRF